MENPPVQNPEALKSVLVTHFCSFYDENVLSYMQDRQRSGGGPVERVDELVGWTFVVHFCYHDDAVNVVRRAEHSTAGNPMCVFLFDEKSRSVYSGHRTIYSQGLTGKQAVDVPRVDPQAPATVLVTSIPHGWNVSEELIKAHFETLKDRTCPVYGAVQYLKPAGIAFVTFVRSEDAMRVVSMTKVSLPLPCTLSADVAVYLLRPLPSDPADTAIDVMVGSTSIEQVLQAEVRRIEYEMGLTMETRLKAEVHRLENQFQIYLGHIKKEVEARLQTQVSQPQVNMVDLMTSGFAQIQRELHCAVDALQRQMRSDARQQTPEDKRSASPVNHNHIQTQVDINRLVSEVEKLTSLLQERDQLYTDMFAEARAQTRAEIVLLTGELRGLTLQTQEARVWDSQVASGNSGFTAQQCRRLTVNNPSDSDSVSLTNEWTVTGAGSLGERESAGLAPRRAATTNHTHHQRSQRRLTVVNPSDSDSDSASSESTVTWTSSMGRHDTSTLGRSRLRARASLMVNNQSDTDSISTRPSDTESISTTPSVTLSETE